MSVPRRSFFKRQLPESLAAFTSDAGRAYFRQALEEGNAEIYFTLASYFATQEDPAFCGLSTLAITLNALQVDPLRVWKGVWRWFSDDMLDCCRSLEDVRSSGITLHEFACLARCNGLAEQTVMADEHATLEQFEADLQRVCSGRDQVMAIGYARAVLQQTGSGHFSPIGAYSVRDRMVLVLDVARFKYPPYWVPVEQLWASLQPLDPSVQRPRGYVLLRRAPQPSATEPRLVRLGLDKHIWAQVLSALHEEADPFKSVTANDVVAALVDAFPSDIVQRRRLNYGVEADSDDGDVLPASKAVNLAAQQAAEAEEESAYHQMLSVIRGTRLYPRVRAAFAGQSACSDSDRDERAALATLLPLAMARGLAGLLPKWSQVRLCVLAESCGPMSTKTSDAQDRHCRGCHSNGSPANADATANSVLDRELDAIRAQLHALTTLVLDDGLL